MLKLTADSMNSWDRVTFLHNVLNESLCDELCNDFDSLHPARWVHRVEMRTGRAISDYKCSYWVSLNRLGLGKEMFDKLMSIAPRLDGCQVGEVVVNKYNPGDYIPDHRDVHLYKYNMTINLKNGNDGIMIEDKFYPDEQGRAVVFHNTGSVHSVPPVKNKRYSLIYLYEIK